MNFTSATGTNRWMGPILIVISAILFGALPIFARLAYAAGATPTTLLFLRFVLAAIVMVCVMIMRRIRFPRGRVEEESGIEAVAREKGCTNMSKKALPW